MSETKLKAGLPKDDEANGLAGSGWANRMIGEPSRSFVAIVTFTTAKKETDYASGKVTAVAQVTAIEPVADEAEAAVLADKLLELRGVRMGGVQVPLDVPEAAPAEKSGKKSNLTILDLGGVS